MAVLGEGSHLQAEHQDLQAVHRREVLHHVLQDRPRIPQQAVRVLPVLHAQGESVIVIKIYNITEILLQIVSQILVLPSKQIICNFVLLLSLASLSEESSHPV